MKTIVICFFLSAFLYACQEEASIDQAKENIWKKNTDNRQGSLDRNQNSDDDPTNAPIDGGVGILLVTGLAYGAKRFIKQRRPTQEI